MIHTNNPIIKHKAGFLNIAQELGNLVKACKVMGVSPTTEANMSSVFLFSAHLWARP